MTAINACKKIYYMWGCNKLVVLECEDYKYGPDCDLCYLTIYTVIDKNMLNVELSVNSSSKYVI